MRTSVGASRRGGALAVGTLFVAAFLPALLAGASFTGCLADTGGSSDGGPDAIAFDGAFRDDGGKGPADSAAVDSMLADTGTLDATLPPADASADAGTDSATPDANDGSLPAFALLRFGNMVPDFATAVDVCVAPEGAPLQGPVAKLAGIPAGVPYRQLTWYEPVPPASDLQVRIVAANASDCSTALVPDFHNLSVTAAQRATVVLLGSTSDAGANAPRIAVFPDDPGSGFPTNNASRIRIIHAAPLSPPADFQIGSGPTYVVPEFTAVPFGATTTASTAVSGGYSVDANGYFVQPDYSEQFTAVVQGEQVTSFANEYSGITAFLTGLPGSITAPLEFLACDDADLPPSNGFFTTCITQPGPPTMSNLRILNLAPSLPALDLCLSLKDGPGTVYGPIGTSVGYVGGAAYDQLTPELAGPVATIPTDTAFTITAVAAGSPCTSAPLFVAEDQYVYGMYRGGPSLVDTTLPIVAGGLTQALSIPQWAYAATAPDAGEVQLSIEVVDLDESIGGGLPPLYDFYDETADGGVQPLVLGVHEVTVETELLAPGTYGLEVDAVDGGGVVYSASGVTFGPGESWGIWLHDQPDGGKGVSRCNFGPPDASTVTTCLE